MESVTVNIPSSKLVALGINSIGENKIDLQPLRDEQLREIIRNEERFNKKIDQEEIFNLIFYKLTESTHDDESLPLTINDIYAELIQMIGRLQTADKIKSSLSSSKQKIKKRISDKKKQDDEKLAEAQRKAATDQINEELSREDGDGYIKGICTLTNCIKKIKNSSPEQPDYACPNYNTDDCLTELDVDDLTVGIYNEIHWATLFKNKMFYFNMFNEYLNRYLVERLTGTFQYLYNIDYDDIGVSAKLITENDHPCEDINVVFQTLCRKGKSLSQYYFAIFHIALHSKESKKYTPPNTSRDIAKKKRNQLACGYYSRAESTSGVRMGAFHYKIDNYTGSDTLTKTKCDGILGDKSPFKKLAFDSVASKNFLLNYNDFQFHDAEIKSDLDKFNKFLIFNMFHNCIYNLFVYYLNEFILPTISNKTYQQYNFQSSKNFDDYCIKKGGFEFLISKLSSKDISSELTIKFLIRSDLNGGKHITILKKSRKGSKDRKDRNSTKGRKDRKSSKGRKDRKSSKGRRNVSIRQHNFLKKNSKK